MKFKEIIFLIFLCAAGILFTHIQTGRLDGEIYLGEGIFFPHDVFTHYATQELEAPFPSVIEIANPDGSVQVEPAAEKIIRIKLEKKIRHKNESEAAEMAEELKTTVSRQNQKWLISTNRNNFDRKPFETNFVISLPAECKVIIKDTAGDVRIIGVKEADIHSRYGDVAASQIQDNVVIRSRHHAVNVDQVGGRCSIESTGSEIKVRGVENGTLIETKYGRIVLEGLKNGAALSCPQTRVEAANIQGLLEIKNSYKPIRLRDTGPVAIDAKQSDVTAAGVTGRLEIRNQYARVKLDRIRGSSLDIRGKSIAVEADDVETDEIYLSSSYRDILLSDFSGNTTIFHSNGQVSLYPAESSFPVLAQGDISDIYLYWPQDKNLWLSAQAEKGKIHWNLAKKPEVQVDNGHTLMKSFLGDAPKNLISLFTKYGTIRVEPVRQK
jgi:hypothetical protein